MKLASRLGAIIFLLFAVGVFFLAVCRQASAIAPENVLVVYNDDSGPAGDGLQIANYYQQVRPGVHIAPISGVDAILTGAHTEVVGGQDYLDVIRPQILSAIGSISDDIEVIVTTKGMPLRIDAGSNPGGFTNWKQYSSLESELTRIDSIDTTVKMGNQKLFIFPTVDSNVSANPYFFDNQPFVRTGSDPVNGDMRLSTRLDAFSVESVKKSIDRSQNVYLVPFGHYIVVDDTQIPPNNDQMTNSAGLGQGLFETITSQYPDDGATNPVPILIENTTESAITSSGRPVLGYVSHGINDGAGPLGPGYIQSQLNFELANGAVFHTYESFNAFSFNPAYSQSQGLIAEWLEIGGTAALGHVQEPISGPNNVTNEDLFYQLLLPAGGASAAPGESGLTFVEAAWNATRQLSFVNTVVGDPLMTIQAWLPGDTNLDGMVEFNDFFTLQGNWLQSGTFEDGDFSGDGIVDEGDFDILLGNWMASVGSLGAASNDQVTVTPELDTQTGWPILLASLSNEANFDGDMDVDIDDAITWTNSYGIDAGADSNMDGKSDGADFLAWQRNIVDYTLTADFNFDISTDNADLIIWQSSYGSNLGGDSDDDYDTDGIDFLNWQLEFNSISGAAGQYAESVPEPTSLSLLIAIGALVLHHRREYEPTYCLQQYQKL